MEFHGFVAQKREGEYALGFSLAGITVSPLTEPFVLLLRLFSRPGIYSTSSVCSAAYLESSSSADQCLSFTTGEFFTHRMREANFKVARLCCSRSERGQTQATMSVRQFPPSESCSRTPKKLGGEQG